ncbi:MAG TPA: SigE family RNA polymerase sigma factor [Mycobacteriales bacterium]|nr:SigE family RNA polymerase sigma factor [Mycobacteriales bacterium]
MEPDAPPTGVTAVTSTSLPAGVAAADDTVAAFYEAAYPRLVGVLTLASGSRADAEEVVQEAFLRLIPRWSRVSRYDDPEAWVRMVAFRLARSRWHSARARARALVRLGAPPDVPAPDGHRVDVERVLATLPPRQREVLVLHHALGLPVDQVAAELGVPVGTVKSRLARARSAAAAAGGDLDE